MQGFFSSLEFHSHSHLPLRDVPVLSSGISGEKESLCSVSKRAGAEAIGKLNEGRR
jgi:hypothetical protein